MKWQGKIGEDVVATARLDGILLTSPKRRCRCGNTVDLLDVAERELGIRLIGSLKELERRAEWHGKWDALMREAIEGKITLDKFYERHVKLMSRYGDENQSPTEAAHSAVVFCPRCLTPMGRLEVALKLERDAPSLELAKDSLISLKASKEMKAYASKRMGFGDVKQLDAWLDGREEQKAKAFLQKTIGQLDDLVLDYDTSKIRGAIQAQVQDIDAEARRRRVEFVDAVEKIVKERVQPIA